MTSVYRADDTDKRVAELEAALRDVLALFDHLREYPKCNPRKFFFHIDRGEHGSIQDAREVLAKVAP